MKWTQKDIDFLIKNISTMSTKDIADKIGHTYQATKKKLYELGIKAQEKRGITWNNDEIKLLKKHYPYASKEYLIKLFPNRTYINIRNKAEKIGLKRISQDRYYVNHEAFSEWNEYSAYFLGFILADGHLCYNGDKYLQICVSIRDKDILEKFISYTEYAGSITKGHKEKHNVNISGDYISNVSSTVRVTISNAKIVKDIIDKGVQAGNKTYTAKFPENIPNNMLRHFIRGVIDGDGWVTVSINDYVSLGVVGTESVVTGVRDNYPVDCAMNAVRHKGENYYDCIINGYKVMNILDWMYSDANVFLDRKYNKYIEAKNMYEIKKSKFSAVGETQQGHNPKTSNS